MLVGGSRAAAVVAAPGRSVTLAGSVAVLDLRRPTALIQSVGHLPEAVRAMLGFAARNAADLAGFVGDLLRGRPGWRVPPVRVLYAVTPDHMAAIENDAVTWSAGLPRPGDEPGAGAPRGGEPAVVTVSGPLGAPARWFANDRLVVVAPPVASLLGIADHAGPMAVVVDRYNAVGPAAKQGMLTMGDALPLGAGRFTLIPERIAEWDGIEVTSRKSR